MRRNGKRAHRYARRAADQQSEGLENFSSHKMVPIKGTRARLQAAFFGDSISNERGTRCPQRVGKAMQICRLISGAFGDSFGIGPRAGWHFFGEADPPHGRGVVRGAKVGNGVAVGAGVAVAAGIGVVTCACAPAKKATKPSRTHTLTKAMPHRIGGNRGWMSELNGSLFHRPSLIK